MTACNASSNNNTQDISYELTENGCATGKHSFSSTSDLCAALQNNSLNNNCAYSLREEEFNSRCPGQTFNPN